MLKQKKETPESMEVEEEAEQYLTYTWEVTGDVHIEFHNCHDIRIMSGQPTQPPPPPPK